MIFTEPTLSAFLTAAAVCAAVEGTAGATVARFSGAAAAGAFTFDITVAGAAATEGAGRLAAAEPAAEAAAPATVATAPAPDAAASAAAPGLPVADSTVPVLVAPASLLAGAVGLYTATCFCGILRVAAAYVDSGESRVSEAFFFAS